MSITARIMHLPAVNPGTHEGLAVPLHPNTIVIPGPTDLLIHHRGPPQEQGPLPTLVYFALSGEESLQLDPFNQPVRFALEAGLRIISFSLPCHGPEFNKKEAMRLWAEEMSRGNDILTPFLLKAHQNIDFLTSSGVSDPAHMAAAGLSRGAFLVLHLASRHPLLNTLLGFAPLVELETLKEFQKPGLDLIIDNWRTAPLIPQLVKKKIWLSIGNRDLRVGTRRCFEFVENLANASFDSGVRSPSVELSVTPSIGYLGHGTSPDAFRAGIDWLVKHF